MFWTLYIYFSSLRDPGLFPGLFPLLQWHFTNVQCVLVFFLFSLQVKAFPVFFPFFFPSVSSLLPSPLPFFFFLGKKREKGLGKFFPLLSDCCSFFSSTPEGRLFHYSPNYFCECPVRSVCVWRWRGGGWGWGRWCGGKVLHLLQLRVYPLSSVLLAPRNLSASLAEFFLLVFGFHFNLIKLD